MNMQADLEYVVDDPKLGFVGCNDRAHALQYADAVDGIAYVQIWVDGEVIETAKIEEA